MFVVVDSKGNLPGWFAGYSRSCSLINVKPVFSYKSNICALFSCTVGGPIQYNFCVKKKSIM